MRCCERALRPLTFVLRPSPLRMFVATISLPASPKLTAMSAQIFRIFDSISVVSNVMLSFFCSSTALASWFSLYVW